MTDHFRMELETFLVEDVILTLGNMRRTFDWVAGADPEADPAKFRAGLNRLDRQIDLIEDRARAVCRQLREAGSGTAAHEIETTAVVDRPDATTDAGDGPIETAILDALKGDSDSLMFRSQRR